MYKQLINLFSVMLLISCFSLKAEDDSATHFSNAQLEQMLAPIALYPDSVLTHILIASTYPLEIVQANRWVKKHPDLNVGEALKRVEDEDWDPSVKALVPFPKILERLSEDLEWAQNLGDAFLQDEERVLASIQSLRRKADKMGNLDKMEHMQISREDDSIIIQPIEREVVYVPYYDPRVVYGSWHWRDYPPFYWDHHYAYHGLYYWHPRIHITHHYYYGAFNWHNHHVIIVDRHHYTSRRYYHRDHILRHDNARRWNHNPTHRRGVAYRSEPLRERYNSNRVSNIETRRVRANDRAVITTRENVRDRDNTRNTNSVTNRNELRSREDLNIRRDANSPNAHRAINSSSTNESTTRQERLRQRLDRDNTHNNSANEHREINSRLRETRPPQTTNERQVERNNVRRSEPVRSEPVRTEPVRIEPTQRAEPVRRVEPTPSRDSRIENRRESRSSESRAPRSEPKPRSDSRIKSSNSRQREHQ